MNAHRLVLTALALALFASGCGPSKDTGPGVTSSTERGLESQPGVGAALPAVGRTVGLHELQEIAQFYSLHREEGTQAYNGVIADLQKGDPKLYQLWQQKACVILPGDPSRPSLDASTTIVAYTPVDAPTKGGLAAFLDGHADRAPAGFTGFTQLGQ